MSATSLNGSIQSLARIAAASARLMASMHRRGRVVDLDQEIDHMQANLDYVREQVARGGAS